MILIISVKIKISNDFAMRVTSIWKYKHLTYMGSFSLIDKFLKFLSVTFRVALAKL